MTQMFELEIEPLSQPIHLIELTEQLLQTVMQSCINYHGDAICAERLMRDAGPIGSGFCVAVNDYVRTAITATDSRFYLAGALQVSKQYLARMIAQSPLAQALADRDVTDLAEQLVEAIDLAVNLQLTLCGLTRADEVRPRLH